MEKPVVFRSESQQIVGMLHLAEVRGRAPAVVFFHGFTGKKVEAHRIFVKTARALAKKGIHCLRFDYRGSGDSEGEFSQMTVASLMADARAAVGFARGVSEVDQERVGVLGFSMGGMIAAQVLAEDARLKAAVLWAPVAEASSLLVEDAETIDRKGTRDLGGWAVSRAFVREYSEADPLSGMGQVKVPVLLLHGDEDDSVPMEHSQEYLKVLQQAGSDTALKIIHGAGHAFESVDFERRVVQESTKWLARHL